MSGKGSPHVLKKGGPKQLSHPKSMTGCLVKRSAQLHAQSCSADIFLKIYPTEVKKILKPYYNLLLLINSHTIFQ